MRNRCSCVGILALSIAVLATGLAYRGFARESASAQDIIDRADALEAVAAHATLRPWTDMPGVAAAAAGLQVNLSLLAQGVDISTDAASEAGEGLPVERDLQRLLRRAPTDVGAWLRLAVLRWSQEQAAGAAAAFQMATLLSPREGAAAAVRVQLALAHWPDLPEAAQRSAARDVALVLAERIQLQDTAAIMRHQPTGTRERAAADLRSLIGLQLNDAEALGLAD